MARYKLYDIKDLTSQNPELIVRFQNELNPNEVFEHILKVGNHKFIPTIRKYQDEVCVIFAKETESDYNVLEVI